MKRKLLISLFSLVGLAATGYIGYYALNKISADTTGTTGSTGIIVKVVNKDDVEEEIQGAAVGVIFANRSADSVRQAFWNPINNDAGNSSLYLNENSFATGTTEPLNANTRQDLFNINSATDDNGLDWYVNRIVPAGNCDRRYAPCFGRDAGFIIWNRSDGGTNAAGLTPEISTAMFSTEIRRIAEATNWAPIKVIVQYNSTTTVKNLVGIGGFLDSIRVGQTNGITVRIPKTSINELEFEPGLSFKVTNFQNQPVAGAAIELSVVDSSPSASESCRSISKTIITDINGFAKLKGGDVKEDLKNWDGYCQAGSSEFRVNKVSYGVNVINYYRNQVFPFSLLFTRPQGYANRIFDKNLMSASIQIDTAIADIGINANTPTGAAQSAAGN